MDKTDGILSKPEIESLISKKEIIIKPLLSKNQIGQISIDLRVGTDFLTSHRGRASFIDTTTDSFNELPIKNFFNETRRNVGESFLIHPNQTILFSTLEYVKIPNDIYGVISCRSSYSRLGLNISTIVQPGYCGCLSIEMVFSGTTPIKILAGSRLIQIRLYKIKNKSDYFELNRKYICQVRPVSSKANEDEELDLLKKIGKKYN